MLIAASACSSEKSAPPKPVHVAIDAGAKADAAPPTFVHGAGRCGECHEKMYDEWERSAHARALTSELYAAAARQVIEPGAPKAGMCGQACHAPLAGKTDGAIASEGVTCDVCHTLRAPKTGGHFELALGDMVKFGPRCDLKDHYFHRMGCSPEHAKATLCGACHEWTNGDVPVFTELSDLVPNKQCQDCHMPKSTAAIAVGSPKRDGVPHHGWLGAAGDLRAKAIALTVDPKPGAIAITVANTGAGHYVPAGLPERRLVITARMSGLTKTWVLGRELLDDDGKPAPFWRAAKPGADTRIAPGKAWTTTWPGAPAGRLEVTVAYRAMDLEIAKSLGQHIDDTVVATYPVAK